MPSAGLPRDVSAHGWRVDQLLQSTHVLVLVVIVAGLAWLAFHVLWRRHSPVEDTVAPHRWTVAVPLLIAAAIFVTIDGNLMCGSRADRSALAAKLAAADKDPTTVRVEINAGQWAWNIRLAGTDGRFATADDVVSVGELHVPLGRPVIIQLASSDVIHSLSIPNLRVKMDAMPGRINTVVFRATRLGDYEIACAQFCGTAHYKMRGLVRVMEPQAFERWLERASADAQRVYAEDTRGRGGPGPSWAWPWRPPR